MVPVMALASVTVMVTVMVMVTGRHRVSVAVTDVVTDVAALKRGPNSRCSSSRSVFISSSLIPIMPFKGVLGVGVC